MITEKKMEKLIERVEINPDIMMGKPVIKGTRITVEIILKKLSQGISIEEILDDYSKLQTEDIYAALSYAAEALSTEEISLLQSQA